MSKILIDETLRGKALYQFLIENKSALIAQKKSMLKRCDSVSYCPDIINQKPFDGTKAEGDGIEVDPDTIRVRVVANTAMWIDSQMDCLLPDSAKRSMRERKGLIPHLHDHIHEIGAEVGDVVDIYYRDLQLSELGINKLGTAQALIFETDIKKAYNEKVFNKYKAKKVKQHSIGLQYVKIELAINDQESEKEYDFWQKYYSQLLNPQAADEKGFFWVVPEYRLLENSAVLFGSNVMTPTLSVGDKAFSADTDHSSPEGTDDQPSEGLNIKQLLNIF